MSIEERIAGLKTTLAERRQASADIKLGIMNLKAQVEKREEALLIVERTIGKLEGAIAAFTGEIV